MTPTVIRSGRAEFRTTSRPPLDPGLRRQFHGRIRPMDEDRTLIQRLFGF